MLNILLDWLNDVLIDEPFKDNYSSMLSNQILDEQDCNINLISKNTDTTNKPTTNIDNIENKPAPITSGIFSNSLTKQKFKKKCIEEIAKYIRDTIYETKSFFFMVEENLEILNDNYPYELILYTMKLQESDFIIAKSTAKKNSLSEEDYVDSLFKIIQENIDSANKSFDFNNQFIK